MTQLSPTALEEAAKAMHSSQPWSSFWSINDARLLATAAITAYLAQAGKEGWEARAEIERLKVEADKYCEWWREERDKNATLRARVREVVGPFAKAGELFGHRLSEEYDQCIYRPAAGDEYSLCGDHLRAARRFIASQEPAEQEK